LKHKEWSVVGTQSMECCWNTMTYLPVPGLGFDFLTISRPHSLCTKHFHVFSCAWANAKPLRISAATRSPQLIGFISVDIEISAYLSLYSCLSEFRACACRTLHKQHETKPRFRSLPV